MDYFKQTFGDEIIYAMTHGAYINGNKKAIIISSVYKKAKKASIQNPAIWKTVAEADVPMALKLKMIKALL